MWSKKRANLRLEKKTIKALISSTNVTSKPVRWMSGNSLLCWIYWLSPCSINQTEDTTRFVAPSLERSISLNCSERKNVLTLLNFDVMVIIPPLTFFFFFPANLLLKLWGLFDSPTSWMVRLEVGHKLQLPGETPNRGLVQSALSPPTMEVHGIRWNIFKSMWISCDDSISIQTKE